MIGEGKKIIIKYHKVEWWEIIVSLVLSGKPRDIYQAAEVIINHGYWWGKWEGFVCL